MFPRNENRNEGTFAKTTLLETALLSPSDPFWGSQKGGFQKGGFGGCSPGTKTGTRAHSPKTTLLETALLSPSDPKSNSGRFSAVSAFYGQNPLKISSFKGGWYGVSGRVGEGVCGWKSGHNAKGRSSGKTTLSCKGKNNAQHFGAR